MAAPTDPTKVTVANLPPEDFDSEFDADVDLVPRKGQTAPAPAAQSTGHVHSQSTKRRAMKLGATAEQIASTPPDELEDWIDTTTEEVTRAREQAAEDRAVQRYHRAQSQPTAAPAREEEDELSFDDEDLEGIRPKLAKALKKIPELVKQNRELRQAGETRAQSDASDAVDEALEEINRPDLYGDGDAATADRTGRGWKVRLALFGAAAIAAGDSPSIVRRKIKGAHKLLYGNAPAPKVEAEEEETPTYGGEAAPLSKKVARQPNGKPRVTPEEYAKGATQPPTNRGKKAPKGRQTAYAAVAQQMQEQGLTDEDFAFEEDGIPE